MQRRTFIQSIGGLTAVASSLQPAWLSVGSSETLTPLASEFGSLLFPDVTREDVATHSGDKIRWAITYEDDAGWDALNRRLEEDDILAHLEDSKMVFARATEDKIGVTTLDRMLGNGIQSLNSIERIDLVVQHERPSPINSFMDEDDFDKPGWWATRGDGYDTGGLAFEAEKTTLGEARENMGVEDADIDPLADLEPVKVGVIDTGCNVDNGRIFGRGERFSPIRIPAAVDYSGDDKEEADVVEGTVTLATETDDDFQDAEWGNFTLSGVDEDASLELDDPEEEAEYTGEPHPLEDVEMAVVDLALEDAEAELTLEAREAGNNGEEWTETLTETVDETDEHEFEIDTDDDENYAEWRWLITVNPDGEDAEAELHAEGVESGEQIMNDDSDWSAVRDGDGHGTYVNAAVAADPDEEQYRGLAADAPVDLYVAKALDDDGAGDTQSIVESIAWMNDHDVDVINLSLGSVQYNEVIDDEIQKFLDDGGSAVVAAAGNDRQLSRWINSPADCANVITVSATTNDPPTEAEVGYFANVGPSDGYSNLSGGETRGQAVDVGAPGMELEAKVTTTRRNLTTESLTGTSMAAPLVTGQIALLLAHEPGLKGEYEEIKGRLKATAEPIPAAGETEVGAGMPQADRLLDNDPPDDDQSEVVEPPAATRDAANETITGTAVSDD